MEIHSIKVQKDWSDFSKVIPIVEKLLENDIPCQFCGTIPKSIHTMSLDGLRFTFCDTCKDYAQKTIEQAASTLFAFYKSLNRCVVCDSDSGTICKEYVYENNLCKIHYSRYAEYLHRMKTAKLNGCIFHRTEEV